MLVLSHPAEGPPYAITGYTQKLLCVLGTVNGRLSSCSVYTMMGVIPTKYRFGSYQDILKARTDVVPVVPESVRNAGLLFILRLLTPY